MSYFWAGVVIFVLYWLFREPKVDNGSDNVHSVDKEDSLNESEESELSEVDKIYKAVEERKQEANRKQLPKLIERLYKEMEYYPTKYRDVDRSELPPSIINISGSKNNKTTQISLMLDSGSLQIQFIDKGSIQIFDDNTGYADLKVYWDDVEVFSFVMSIDWNSGGKFVDPEWQSTSSINGYIPGKWENELINLEEKIRAFNDQRAKQRQKNDRENPEKIKELKNKFDV